MENMRERVIRLYEQGELSLGGLIHAVEKGLINEDRFFVLTNMTLKNAKQKAFPEIYRREENEVETDA